MEDLHKKYIVVAVLILLGFAVGVYYLLSIDVDPLEEAPEEEQVEVIEEEQFATTNTIGTSVEGRPIEAYTFGNGGTDLLFVGGIHGGYEWNSVLLAYSLIDHLTEEPHLVPENLTVTVIPSANPDGLFDVLGMEGRFTYEDVPKNEGPLGNGRFNANDVDLNRNFDCKWKPESMWRGNVVSAGDAAFSEPEAQAIRDYVLATNPVAAVFFHSQSNAVYASECEAGVLGETRELMNIYAGTAGYPAVDSFDFYEITGDAEGWLASIGIPAITVELATHETVEWEKNRAGIEALLSHYNVAK